MINGLPERLKELRQINRLTQKDVAERLGLSPSIISGYETGERTPSVEIILSLSYLYKCSTDYLLGKESMPPEAVLCTKGLSTEQIHALDVLLDTMRTT